MAKKIYIGSAQVAGLEGKSAYRSWLDQGNIGTEQDFLDSLKAATVITNDGSEGDSVAILLTDSQFYKRSFRIDLTGVYTGGAVIQRIGSLIIECFDEGDDLCHGYYYGDDMSDILTEVAVYQDDQDSDIFYLMLTHESDLDSVTFAISPTDSGEVDAIITNAGDDHTKIEDATITTVGSGGGDGKMGVISQTQTWSGTGSNPRTYVMSNLVMGMIPQANIDLFESAGATFNTGTGYFELNGLTDLSYEEMREVYYKTIAAKEIPDKSFMFAYDNSLRTNLPTSNVNRVSASYLSAANRVNLFYACIGARIEVFAVLPVTATQKAIMSDMRASFQNAYNLKRIQGIWDFSNVSGAGNLFGNCYSLESVSIYHLKIALSLANSSLLDKASLLYMINNEASTSAITITLHASVYAKCQSGGEWYSDISTALASHTNISLASA